MIVLGVQRRSPVADCCFFVLNSQLRSAYLLVVLSIRDCYPCTRRAMHSVIIVGGWIMIIVETQLHSGNLESSQRNLEEVPRTQSNAVQ